MPTSWKPEVFVEGNWSPNQLRFATEPEAKAYADDLYSRWTLVEKTRAGESDDPVNSTWVKGFGLTQNSAAAEAAPPAPATEAAAE